MYTLMKLILLVFFIEFVNSFNIDTNFPIIYNDVNPNSNTVNRSYFGYSVILYDGGRGPNSKPWIQIGAPRGHNFPYMHFDHPGLVYRCEIGKTCNNFPVDMKNNYPDLTGVNKNVKPKKDAAWIGASMDIDTKNDRIVICGPRWINIKGDNYYISGACYWSNITEQGTKELLPLARTDSAYEVKDHVYYYPMGQAGMSVHFPETNTAEVVMGAPGVYNWKGVIVQYKDDAKQLLSINKKHSEEAKYKDKTVPDPARIKDVYAFGYLGYSISSGYFFSRTDLTYVAGAPRSNFLRGQVLLFTFSRSKDNIRVKQTVQGEMTGEYFGAALGVADIDGDKLDDLIVGAPHYSANFDEGRIYIFFGNRVGKLRIPEQYPTITGNYSGGQFGTAIQSLGDIDNDGTADIAVGSPYEDENHGVIYIYNGNNKAGGPPLILTQRIEGKRLHPTLKGFGISFSRPTDIDKNNYKDVAVGSYLSDNAVILRTRPSAILRMDVKALQKRLDRNSKEFSIRICLSYYGRDLPASLNINRTILLDQNNRRVYRQNYVDTKTVRNAQMTCENITFNINPSNTVKNGFDPIEIFVRQELVENKVKSEPVLIGSNVRNNDKFCKTCPVVNKILSQLEENIKVQFALNCGDDNKCDSDLQVSGEFIGLKNDEFVIGLYKTLRLNISVINKNELAYQTDVEVTLPENVYLSAKPAECDDKTVNNTLIVTCFIDNPLEKGKLVNKTLEFDMDVITTTKQRKLPFLIRAKSSSDDINPKDNTIVKNLALVTDANIKIIGKTEKSIYYFDKDALANATQVFEVQKSGVSPLNEFTLNVSIPVAYKKDNEEIHFLSIHKPQGFQARQILTCDWEEEYIKDFEVQEVEKIDLNMTRKKRALDDDSANSTDIFDVVSVNKTTFINCSMSEIICKTVSCIVGPFSHSLKGASLQIKMVIDMNTISKHILGDNVAIFLSTDGKVKETEGRLMDHVRVSTAFVKEPEEHKLETWIIIVAVISGILILLLIVLGLVKAGFFERKQKQELEALKQAEDKSNPKVPTKICFLDWQLSLLGPPVLDLLYFIYACTDKKLRDEHFDQLLKDYYQTLGEFTKELGTDLEKHYSYEIMMDQFKEFGRYGLTIAIMLLHLLLSDADEIPDINTAFDDPDGDQDKMFEAFQFESKNVDAYNTRIRDTILHVVEKGFI